jgi:hypothetical protein
MSRTFRASVEFQDADGFIIDVDRSDPFTVGPESTYTETGYALISQPAAEEVVRAIAKVNLVR